MILLALMFSAWTNTAGNVIVAAPIRLVGEAVEMRREGTEASVVCPLSAFPAAERRRLRLALGEGELPKRAADIRVIFAAELARAEARAEAGRLTAEELAAKRANIAAAWVRELRKERHGLTATEIEYWKDRLNNEKK